ncbi:type II secretion system F family protein [Kineococcus rhizosphaerae]|uniref:Tight adherence protein C n=1 Tax=Kineococcus rhizosphaerae TaxID=559628 RepID=A0A2T0R3X5_9ACTN|nr:type II secretion system F family protein [Kineococcus rhizosphaerae]PRY14746.1 tight adherence protein C [Kineococcus rhizosphaerae]
MIAGVCLGLLAGTGALLVVAGFPLRRAPSLDARVLPYLAPAPTRRTRELLRRVGTAVGTRLGSGRAVTDRLLVLDPDADGAAGLAAHRAEQVVWSCAGTGLALAGVWLGAGFDPVAIVAAMVVGALAGALARDELLARAVTRRRTELVADLPAVAELLALSVAAGENVAAALERVATGHGPLCAGLRGALGRVRTGTPLLEALTDLAGRWQVPPFTRFVDALVVAVEAGSPLADVLRAQAADARDAEHRRLTETGGHQEVRMMVPVVFGILPTVVVFAVYPGLAQLQLTN